MIFGGQMEVNGLGGQKNEEIRYIFCKLNFLREIYCYERFYKKCQVFTNKDVMSPFSILFIFCIRVGCRKY